jgi:geranylgeranyl reductase family protein
MEYDVIVVGAGTGGAVASETASRLGLKTLLLERKSINEVGNKVCGDGIEGYQFSDLNIPIPRGDVVQNTWKYIRIYAPNQKNYLRINVNGIIVDRKKFTQYLLKRAIDSNVEFRDKVLVLSPIIRNRTVTGVKIKNKKNGLIEDIRARVVIDASGFNSLLRKSLKSPYIDNIISKRDIWICYREIIETTEMDFKLDYIGVGFSQNRSPREHWWAFPKSKTSLNVGVCVWGNSKINAKKCYQNYFKSIILPRITPPIKVIQKGGGVEPIRRPLWSLVENGIMFVGDAGCCVNPVSGAGIGSSMRTGKLAGEVAAEAIGSSNYSIDALWKYNRIFATARAGGFTALHIIRILFRKLSDEDLNHLIKSKLIQGDDLLRITVGQSLLSNPIHIIQSAIGGIEHPEVLMYLSYIFLLIRKIKKLYQAYPDRSEFQRWKHSVQNIYDLVKSLAPTMSLFKKEKLFALFKILLKPS